MDEQPKIFSGRHKMPELFDLLVKILVVYGEKDARTFYTPKLLDILKAAGAQYGFIAPADTPSMSRHLMGTMRVGTDPTTSVCDPHGKLHDVDNVYCMDGGVFVTSSGYNPTLTIITLALRAAGNVVFPGNPDRVIGR